MSLLISLVTRCPITHAAIYDEKTGKWWHASETEGKFCELDIHKFSDRECWIFEFNGDLTGWLNVMKGALYDWMGVLGWIYNLPNNDSRFYCFEAVYYALRMTGVSLRQLSRVSGCDLLEMSVGHLHFGRFGAIGK